MFVLTLLFVAIACVSSGQAEIRFLRKPLGSSRIINGINATLGEFPHQTTLLVNGYHRCGGSVIAQDWVLTAAHCVDGQSISTMAIVVDLHDFSNPGSNYIWFDIDEVIMHENYSKGLGAFPNDVALLRLHPNTNNITKNIVNIAEGSYDYAGEICTITGWGVTVAGTAASVLQKADVTVLAESNCTSYWGGDNILPQHVCVKGYDIENGRGSCNGDSGGPLVCLDDGGKYELVGVTSWGLSGCHTNGIVTHPSVYARVTYFSSWINENCGNCAN